MPDTRQFWHDTSTASTRSSPSLPPAPTGGPGKRICWGVWHSPAGACPEFILSLA